MLAGRKLLLADDSVTVQKVVDLTFADEGVEVIIAGDGEEAIEKVEQLLPDVVLVDVFMPVFNGYEVCEFIKTSEKLKHIPVMLLVGSFEPFDEAEARRVGANDILTKPFQSIRRLIDRVGELVTVKPPETEVPTAELPTQPEEPEEARLSTAEIEITTADTMQLPAEMAHPANEFAAEPVAAKPSNGENKMESRRPRPAQTISVSETADTLLDLGDLEPAEALEADDFELELDMDEIETSPAPFAAPALAESQVSVSVAGWEGASPRGAIASDAVLDLDTAPAEAVTEDVKVEMKDFSAAAIPAVQTAITSQDLSPEMIDAIASRVVERLSERVVQEIAWEVVPPLAELLIKRQLEERESQAK